MRSGPAVAGMFLAVLGACRTYTPPDEVASGPTTVVATTVVTTVPPTVGRTTTTARPLTRTEASTKLCQSINSANSAAGSGNLVAAGLRLGGGISSYGVTADPLITAAARRMLSAGTKGDVDGYLTARDAASPMCARVGAPVASGGGHHECLTTPCP